MCSKLVECRVSKYCYDLSFESSDGMSARRKKEWPGLQQSAACYLSTGSCHCCVRRLLLLDAQSSE